MKKYIFSLVLFVLAFSAQGQKNKDSERYAEIQALQIAFITEKLSLTPEESQQFWPVHNAFNEKSKAIRSGLKTKKNIEELSDSEAMGLVNARLKADEQMLALRTQYVKDLELILPPQKIAKLFNIEHDFKRKMLKNIREKRKEKQ